MIVAYFFDQSKSIRKKINSFSEEDFLKLKNIIIKYNVLPLKCMDFAGDIILNRHQIHYSKSKLSLINDQEKKSINFFIEILNNLPAELKKNQYLHICGE